MPKLKYYLTALKPVDYQEFETTRQIVVDLATHIDPVSGRVIDSRREIILTVGVPVCDALFRQQWHWQGPLYILRIPRDAIPVSRLETVDPDGIWRLRETLTIPHCGVERTEITAQYDEIGSS